MKRSLSIKVNVIIVLVVSITFLVFGAFELWQTKSKTESNLNQSLSIITERLANTLIPSLWTVNKEGMALFVRSEMEDKNVYAVLIRSSLDDALILGRVRDETWQLRDVTESDIIEAYIHQTLPIIRGDEELGAVEVYLTDKFLNQQINSNITSLIIKITLLLLFIVMTLAIIINNNVSHPVQKLMQDVEIIAAGNLKQPIDASRTDEIGRLAKSFAHMRDAIEEKITDLNSQIQRRKQAEEELRRERDRAQQYLEIVEVVLVALNNKGEITLINKKGCAILGYEEAELVGRSWFDTCLPAELRKSVRDVFRQLMAGEIEPVEYYENPVLTKSGEERIIAWHNTVLKDKTGNIIGTLASGEDITRRKKQEAELRKYRNRLEELVKERTDELTKTNDQLQQEIIERKQIEKSLHSLTTTFSAVFGREFFNKVSRHLAITFEVDYAFIGELAGNNDEVKVLGGFGKGQILEPFTYGLADTPCENVMGQTLCCYPSGVREQFPKDYLLVEMGIEGYIGSPIFDSTGRPLGIMVLLDSKPIAHQEKINVMFQIFVDRVSAEIERARAEEALRESEEKFRNIVENIPMGMHMYQLESDDRLVFTGANPAADRILGVANNQFVGKTIEEAFPASAPMEMPERYRLAASIGEPWQTDRIIYEENEISGAYAVYAFQTSPGRMVATFQDITERIRTEEALRESEEKYRTLFETMIQGVVYQDASGKIISANSAAERILGLTLDQMQGRTSIDPRWKAVHEDGSDFPGETHPAMAALKTGKPVKDVLMGVYNPAEEQYHWIIVNAVPQFRAGEDKPYQVYATFNDITKRRQVEAALRESEAQYADLYDNAPDMYVSVEAATARILQCNQRLADELGYTKEEIIERSIFDVYHPDCLDEVKNKVFPSFIKTGQVHDAELQLKRKDGTRLDVSLNVSAVRDETGRILHSRSSWRDITERKHMEQKIAEHTRDLQKAKEAALKAQHAAEAANQAKTMFLANMSHELRTPLNGVLGYAQILNRDKSLTARQRDAIDLIHRSGKHLLTLINDVLDLSKIEAGKMELTPIEFQFPQFLKRIAGIAGMQARQKGLRFDYQTPPTLPAGIEADKTRLRQILLNLLGNAVKFTKKGSVTLRVSEWVSNSPHSTFYKIFRFEVEDTGIGISPDKQANIFLPFHQAGDDRWTRPQGTGLGLAISRKLVRMMGSELHVESVAGQGSRFWFDLKLPTVAWPDTPLQVGGRTIISFSGNKHKILIADDRGDNRRVLKDLLAPLGFETMEAVDGHDALAKATEFQPDLIFMDLVMPEMDGFEATRRLRRKAELKDVVIVAISASVYGQTREQSLAAGCDDFIAKPFELDELLEKLQVNLQLKWIYADQDKTQPASIDPAQTPLISPPQEELAALLEMTVVGDIIGIREQMKEIEALGLQFTPFITQFKPLVKAMKMDETEKLIRQYLEGEE